MMMIIRMIWMIRMFEIIFQIPDHVPAHRPATLVLCSLGSHRKVGKYSGENNNNENKISKNNDNENNNYRMLPGFSSEGENIFWRK